MVRKRRNSVENTVSPRQTRRGRVKNDDVANASAATVNRSPETPSTSVRATRARGRQATTSKTSNESDNEPVQKYPRMMKKKGAKADSSIQTSPTTSGKQKNVNVSLESLNSSRETVIEAPVTGTKKREKLKNDSLISEDDSSPIKKRSPAKKSLPVEIQAKKNPGKNAARATRPRVASKNDSLISEDESPSRVPLSRSSSRINNSKNSLISEDESTLIDESDFEKSLKSTGKKKIVNTPRKPIPRKSSKTDAKTFANTVTPECSPMIVTLTPHRSTKTPRKSPKNLSSPKTHAQTPLRLSKTPRKLPVTVESPATSDKSGVSSNHSTPITQDSAGNTPNVFAEKITEVKISSPSPGSSGRTTKTLLSRTKLVSPKFSKSPKIVLKSPKSKLPSPKKKLSVLSCKVKRSPMKIGFGRSPRKASPKAAKLSPTILAGSSKLDSSLNELAKSPSSGKLTKSPKTLMKSSKKSPKTPSPEEIPKTPSPNKSKVKLSKVTLRNPRIILTAVQTPKRTPLKKISTPASKVKKSPIKTPSPRSPSKLLSPKSKSPSLTPKIQLKKRVAQSKKPQSKLRTPVKKPSVKTPKNSPTESPSPRARVLLGSPSKKSPKSLKTIRQSNDKSTNEKRSPAKTSGTPLRPINTPRSTTLRKSTSKLHLESSRGTPKVANKILDKSKSPGAPSPRGRIRRSLNLTPDFRTVTPEATSSPIHTPKASSKKTSSASKLILDKYFMSDFTDIQNESAPLMTDSQLMNVSDSNSRSKNSTYEIDNQHTFTLEDEKTDKENATYELAEPKTPNLRRNSRKRSLSVADLDNSDPEVKRRCRVRFASPVQFDIAKSIPDSRSVSGKSNITLDITKRIKSPGAVGKQSLVMTKRLSEPEGKSLAKGLSSRRANISLRRRSNSLSTMEMKTLVGKTETKRRSNSASDANVKRPRSSMRAQSSSVNRLSKPKPAPNSEKKSETRTPVARKAPNFALIHQKKFEKMESLVDAKRRVAERHVLLNNSIPEGTSKLASKIPKFTGLRPSEKIAPSDTVNGTFNRFGFKLRKNEAKNIITKRLQPAKTRDQKAQDNRTLLKSVRLNKRFELQMKSRNLK